jgi:hypothetical protein
LLSELAFGHSQHETLEVFPHCDETRESAVFGRLKRKSEGRSFLVGLLFDLRAPGFIDVDLAGSSTAIAATVGVDASDAGPNGAFHETLTWIDIDLVLCSIVVDESNLRHEPSWLDRASLFCPSPERLV